MVKLTNFLNQTLNMIIEIFTPTICKSGQFDRVVKSLSKYNQNRIWFGWSCQMRKKRSKINPFIHRIKLIPYYWFHVSILQISCFHITDFMWSENQARMVLNMMHVSILFRKFLCKFQYFQIKYSIQRVWNFQYWWNFFANSNTLNYWLYNMF